MFDVKDFFCTPLIFGKFPEHDRLVEPFKNLLYKMEENPDKYRNQNQFNTTLGDVFDTTFDLFRIQEPIIQRVASVTNHLFGGIVQRFNGHDSEIMSKLRFHYHAWGQITRDGGQKTLHNHPNASWSLVYYIDRGDPSGSGQSDRNGNLQIYDPRGGSNMYQDWGNLKVGRKYSHNGYSYSPKSGEFVAFPSALFHEVLPYHGTSPRVIMAVNCWVTKSG